MATANYPLSLRRNLALIIGNDVYSHSSNRLKYSVSNANDLSERLTKIGFEVTKHTDLKMEEFSDAFKRFRSSVQDDDLVLFYYSGHTYQVNGINYLISTDDGHLVTGLDVETSGINIEHHIKRIIKEKKLYAAVFVLDCSKPYTLNKPRQSQSNGSSPRNPHRINSLLLASLSSKGLHEMKPPSGTLIQYSCNANETVNDAVRTAIQQQLGGRDNLFTRHMLNHIDKKNLDIRIIFRTVADAVYEESSHRQMPLTMDGLATDRQFYLHYVADPIKKPPIKLKTKQFLTDQPLSQEEKNYYEECKEYYRLTKHPLIAVSDEIYDPNTRITSFSLKLGIDENCNKFDLQEFLTTFSPTIGFKMKDFGIKRIQNGSAILEIEIDDKFEGGNQKLRIKAMVDSLNDNLRDELGKMKIFFMYMGPIKSLDKIQKFRSEIKLNPKYNYIYSLAHNFWKGALNDGRDRGGKPYYCPVGWKRWSFYVTDHFDQRFKGWCICYHANVTAYGEGVYASPSIKYTTHPRYAEVKPIHSSSQSKFFPRGQYAQFVLECRVDPNSIKVIGAETLKAEGIVIDPNVPNDEIEWLISNQHKRIIDFNDPSSPIVCTGIMVRITDEHPGFLSESEWWFKSHLCDNVTCCQLGISTKVLQQKLRNGSECNIIYD